MVAVGDSVGVSVTAGAESVISSVPATGSDGWVVELLHEEIKNAITSPIAMYLLILINWKLLDALINVMLRYLYTRTIQGHRLTCNMSEYFT